MRMWMIDPSLLCRNHLLGEHKEIHMLAGCVRLKKSLVGYIDRGLIELTNLNDRHDKLVVEMTRRGYNHQSPLPLVCSSGGLVDLNKSTLDLKERCPACAIRIASVEGRGFPRHSGSIGEEVHLQSPTSRMRPHRSQRPRLSHGV